jgi:pyrroline-5-carboxylate reductase
MRIALIGYGSQGRSFAYAWRHQGLVTSGTLTVYEILPERIAEAKAAGWTNVADRITEQIGQNDQIWLAVKPKDFGAVVDSIKPFYSPNQLVVSMLAGKPMSAVYEALGTQKVVRTMPNLGVRALRGLNTYVLGSGLLASEAEAVKTLLQSVGVALEVADEDRIDAATAVHGSGLGYVFEWLAAFQAAAQSVGFSPQEARELVDATIQGSAALLAQEDWGPAPYPELVSRVASPGGTTEAGLTQLREGELFKVMQNCVQAAYSRAKELAG